MEKLQLSGCSPEPLIHYLKALGVLRLLSTQKESQVRGYWEGDSFVLQGRLQREELINFFLHQYRPTPLLAPWNGGSGFYGIPEKKAAKKNLLRLENTDQQRLQSYAQVIKKCKELITGLGVDLEKNKSFNDETKQRLVERCRSELPDIFIETMDVMMALTGEKTAMAPLMGTGGNDGNLEFTATFISNLMKVIPVNSNPDRVEQEELARSEQRLAQSLFGGEDAPLVKVPSGQFYPGGIGGPNASAEGISNDTLVNPWDYVLGMEGILLFSGSVSRRMEAGSGAYPVFPFSVRASSAGWGTLSVDDVDTGSRGEIWLPLWNKPVSYRELRHLFSEGRARAGSKAAQNGLDFARAAASLGVDRGISSFQRMGFISGARFGKMYLAAPLGRFPVQAQPQVNLLEDLDRWLGTLQYHGRRGTTGALRDLVRRLEEAVFSYCRHGGPRYLQEVIMAVGQAHQAVGANNDLKESLSPLVLDPQWVPALDDRTPEFRLAAAVASIKGDEYTGPVRENLDPVSLFNRQWPVWEDTGKKVEVSDLPRTLTSILEKRMLAAGQKTIPQLPVEGRLRAQFVDINCFLKGTLDEEKLLRLICGLALVNWAGVKKEDLQLPVEAEENPDTLYSLLKLLFLPGALTWPEGSEPVNIRFEKSVLLRLRSGNVPDAVNVALRRLKASGFSPCLNEYRTRAGFMLEPQKRYRLGAALIIPVAGWRRMAQRILEKPVLQV